jgi:hypothetical protein
MTKKKKKKLKPHSDDNLYFLHEENRALWQGRSKTIHNRREARCNLYHLQPSQTSPVSTLIQLVILLSLNVIFGILLVLLFSNPPDAPFLAGYMIIGLIAPPCGAYLLFALFTACRILYRQMQMKQDNETLSDMIRYGTRVTGTPEDWKDIGGFSFVPAFSYEDTAGNLRRVTYVDKQVSPYVLFPSRKSRYYYADSQLDSAGFPRGRQRLALLIYEEHLIVL